MRTLWMLLFLMFGFGELEAQISKSDSNQSKLPPGMSIGVLSQSENKWIIHASKIEDLEKELKLIRARVIERYPLSNCVVVETIRSTDLIKLLHSPSVQFLQPAGRKLKEELLINGFDLGTNRINLVHRKLPSITGSGLVAAIKENKFDTTDIDFKGRYLSTGLSSSTVTGHAGIMATMVGGGGNSYNLGEGVAWDCQLSSTNFAQLLPSPATTYSQFRISVENHSYGVGIENFYGADAAAYDASVANNSTLVHVFSSGNSGTSTSTSGNYAGVSNFANLTGSFKMAKNIITVGATDSFANVEVLSSRGPAFDGRVKPDLVAFGQDGSSGAAALVSGTSLLIQHAYKIQHHDSLPPASLLKATLINSSDDLGAPGPDYITGFGSLNADKAVQSITGLRYFMKEISSDDTQIISVNIPAGIKQLKVTMAYTDLPAQPNAFKALVNDLDLELNQVSSGQSWRPWVLNSSPNRDSLLKSASRRRDSLNNVEQISVDNPVAGIYQMRVYGHTVTNGSQAYSIVFWADTADRFEWNFPTRNDPVHAGSIEVARWSESFDVPGNLEFSGNNGASWQLVSSNVNLENKYARWQAPDSFSNGILRMSVNGKVFTSDTFVISKNIQLHVGFNCEDSVLLYWNRINRANRYQLYGLTSNFLQPISATIDTFFVFGKSSFNTKHFTVAPALVNGEGTKAFTINYETQGVGCYIKEYLVQLDGNKALIRLELGSLYRLKQIEIQKDNGNSFLSFQTITNPGQMVFDFENGNLHAGLNQFRVKLTLDDGRIIYSTTEIIYYLGNLDFIVYPNPTAVASGFKVLRKDLDDATLLLYDLYGRRILQVVMKDLVNPIPTSTLQRGVYFIAIYNVNGNRKYRGKIVLQ